MEAFPSLWGSHRQALIGGCRTGAGAVDAPGGAPVVLGGGGLLLLGRGERRVSHLQSDACRDSKTYISSAAAPPLPPRRELASCPDPLPHSPCHRSAT